MAIWKNEKFLSLPPMEKILLCLLLACDGEDAPPFEDAVTASMTWWECYIAANGLARKGYAEVEWLDEQGEGLQVKVTDAGRAMLTAEEVKMMRGFARFVAEVQ